MSKINSNSVDIERMHLSESTLDFIRGFEPKWNDSNGMLELHDTQIKSMQDKIDELLGGDEPSLAEEGEEETSSLHESEKIDNVEAVVENNASIPVGTDGTGVARQPTAIIRQNTERSGK